MTELDCIARRAAMRASRERIPMGRGPPLALAGVMRVAARRRRAPASGMQPERMVLIRRVYDFSRGYSRVMSKILRRCLAEKPRIPRLLWRELKMHLSTSDSATVGGGESELGEGMLRGAGRRG